MTAQAMSIVDAFSSDSTLDMNEALALNRFVAAGSFVQRRVVSALANPRTAAGLAGHGGPLQAAVNRLSERERSALREPVRNACDRQAGGTMPMELCSALWTSLQMGSPTSEQLALLLAAEPSGDPDLADIVSAERAAALFEDYLVGLSPRQSQPSWLCTLFDRMGPIRTRQAVGGLLKRLSDPETLAPAVSILKCSTLNLRSGELNTVAEAAVAALQNARSVSAVGKAVDLLAHLPTGAFFGFHAEHAIEAIIARAENASSNEERGELLMQVERLARYARGAKLDRVWRVMSTSVASASRPSDIQYFQRVASLCRYPSPELFEEFSDQLVRRVRTEPDLQLAAGYAEVLGLFEDRMGPAARRTAAQTTFARLERSTATDTAARLAAVLYRLGPVSLRPDQRATVTATLFLLLLEPEFLADHPQGEATGQLGARESFTDEDVRTLRQGAADQLRRWAESFTSDDARMQRQGTVDQLRKWAESLEEEDARALVRRMIKGKLHNAQRRSGVAELLRVFPAAAVYSEITKTDSGIPFPTLRLPEDEATIWPLFMGLLWAMPPDDARRLVASFIEWVDVSPERTRFLWAAADNVAPWAPETVWDRLFSTWVAPATPSVAQTIALARVAGHLPEHLARTKLEDLIKSSRLGTLGECWVGETLVRPLTASRIRDTVLTWPGCSEEGPASALLVALRGQGIPSRQP